MEVPEAPDTIGTNQKLIAFTRFLVVLPVALGVTTVQSGTKQWRIWTQISICPTFDHLDVVRPLKLCRIAIERFINRLIEGSSSSVKNYYLTTFIIHYFPAGKGCGSSILTSCL